MNRRRLADFLHPVLRTEPIRNLALRLGTVRGRSMVLLYHPLIDDDFPVSQAITPPVSSSLFRAQLQALLEIGTIVPLHQLLESAEENGRGRFAVTFDDDDPAHVELALPVLNALGVSATFFLSGRVLHGLQPYWWNVLGHLIATDGLAWVCRRLGVPAATPASLARTLESAPYLTKRLYDLGAASGPRQLDAEGIRRLAEAGMDIGFHTVHHPVLPTLAGADLDFALQFGRTDLVELVDKPVDLLAYPHAKADQRVVRRAEQLGFRSAFVEGGRPFSRKSNRYFIGRWEPGPLQPDRLVSAAILRLHRPIAVPPR